ncbi:unnamed protein product [Ectocarpus sp. CCAP 1310/34]|nr:unnamed protein product [Ectocarpus sp. CCAP 1310/34]
MSTSSAAPAPAVAILPAKAPLPLLDDGLTVVSFNVLLPNGNDGWWMYKSYQPHVPEEHRVWPFRKALMREYLLSKDADIVCVQEASAETFETDFDFMKDAGYDHVLHTKFRFRSATFFKTSRLELASEKHKDRVLVTGLRTLPPATSVPSSQAPPSQSPPPPPGNERTEVQEPSEDVDPSSKTDAQPSNRGGSTAAEHPPAAAAESSRIRHLGGGEGSADDGGGASSRSGKGRLVMVVNCHLTGGPAPERRMRQVLDGLDAARKDAVKLLSEEAEAAAAGLGKKKGGGGGGKKGGGGAAAAPGTSVPVVVCGDLNSNSGHTAVCELLSTGVVGASFREGGYPETAITSKDKRQGFGPFGDIYEEAYGGGDPAGPGVGGGMGGEPTSNGPPPTFLVPLLHPHFLSEDGEGVSARLQVALSEAFYSLVGACGNTARAEDNDPSPPPPAAAAGDPTTPGAEPEAFLPREGVEAWLMKINRSLGRGSEFRAAEAIMGPGPGGGLTLEDFFSIYASELRGGKFWGVAHDLHALGVELPGGVPWVGPYTARFDRVFYSKATLEAVGAMEPLCEEERELVAGGDCLPNSWHPSDHLAVAGAFRFR